MFNLYIDIKTFVLSCQYLIHISSDASMYSLPSYLISVTVPVNHTIKSLRHSSTSFDIWCNIEAGYTKKEPIQQFIAA